MGRGAWKAAVHGVAKSRTRLSDFHALEKEMATHSSVLAWRIPGTGEPGGLPSMGSHRVGHDWSDLAAAAALPDLYCGAWPRGMNSFQNPLVRIRSLGCDSWLRFLDAPWWWLSVPGTAMPAGLSHLWTENLAWQFSRWESANIAWKTCGLQPTETARSWENSKSLLCLSCRWCQILGEWDLLYPPGEMPLASSENGSVMSDSLQAHGLYSLRNSPGRNTGVGSLSLLQNIFSNQGSNPGLPHCRQILYQLRHKGSPCIHGVNTIRNIYCPFQLKPDKVFERIFQNLY